MASSYEMNETWKTIDGAKRYVADLQQLQKEIRLPTSEITLAKQHIRASYANQKAHRGTRFGSGGAKGLPGAKTMGKAHTVTRNNLRQGEMKALEPYVEAEQLTAKVLAGANKLETCDENGNTQKEWVI